LVLVLGVAVASWWGSKTFWCDQKEILDITCIFVYSIVQA